MLGAEEANSLDPLMMVGFKLSNFKCIHDQIVNRGWHCRVKAVPALSRPLMGLLLPKIVCILFCPIDRICFKHVMQEKYWWNYVYSCVSWCMD
jgi:hypothetical protein